MPNMYHTTFKYVGNSGALANNDASKIDRVWEEVQTKNRETGLGWKAPNTEKENDHETE